MTPPAVDRTHLLKLRLVVARHGEMEAARWWNSQNVLGRHGTRRRSRRSGCIEATGDT